MYFQSSEWGAAGIRIDKSLQSDLVCSALDLIRFDLIASVWCLALAVLGIAYYLSQLKARLVLR